MRIFGIERMARAITKAADSIELPKRRHVRTRAKPIDAGPALVRGRGLARRRPRSPLSSLLAWSVYLLLGAAIMVFVARTLLQG